MEGAIQDQVISLMGHGWTGRDILNAGTVIYGNIWYVNDTIGSDSFDGRTSSKPKATIQAGIDAASARDTIYISTPAPNADASDPGEYVEDLTIAYAKHGLRLIGIGSSVNKMPFAGPKLKNATAVALLTVNASGVYIENLQFNCTRNSGTYGINFTGVAGYATLAGSVGFTVRNCFIKNAGATYGGIYVYAGYGGMITNCTFQMCAKGVYIDSNAVPSNGHNVEYCNFKNNNGAAVAEHLTIVGGAEDFNVDHCNFDAATNFLTCGGGTSGLITNCCFADTVATLANSTGKVTVPANQSVKVTGCWGGVSLAVIQSAA